MRLTLLVLALLIINTSVHAQAPVLDHHVNSLQSWVKLTDLSTCEERRFRDIVTPLWLVANQQFEGLHGSFSIERDSSDRIKHWSFEPAVPVPSASLPGFIDRLSKRLGTEPTMPDAHTYSWTFKDRECYVLFKETDGSLKIIYGEDRPSES